MLKTNKRPVFLNLLQIRLPLNAVASIMHRVAGVVMVFSLPFLIYLFELSLRNEDSFQLMTSMIDQPLISAIMYLLLWAISHHFFAGIRYFLVDFEMIAGRSASRISAVIAIIAGILVPLIIALRSIL